MVILLTITTFLLAFLISAAGRETPRFTIETDSNIHANCTLETLNDKGIVASDGAAPIKISDSSNFARRPSVAAASDDVLLHDGRPYSARPWRGAVLEEERLIVGPAKASFPAANAKGLSLYLPYVAAALWSLPEGVDDADLFVAQLQVETRKRDVIFLKNGDRIEGTLTSLSAKSGAGMMVGAKRIETPWPKLAGLALSTDRAVRPRSKKPYVRAVLEDGSRVSLQDLRLDAKSRHFLGKTLFGTTLELPEAALVAFDTRQDQAVDLSELTPSQYEQRPFLGASWPLAKDVSATAQPLRLAGSTFEKGIGVHAPCRVTYKLDGKFERFDALVGIDESARRGRAKIALELDGKRIDLNEAKEMTAKDAPVVLRQNVRGVRELTLIVEVGAFGDVQANVNWAKARLISKK